VLDNAVSYVNEGGRLRIDAASAAGRAWLRVANSGSRVPAERVGELLRRFTRGDASRRASGNHFGLGLAITSRIVSALGGEMEISSSEGGEFELTLSLRVAP
jgi:signal transduction histidine kinase